MPLEQLTHLANSRIIVIDFEDSPRSRDDERIHVEHLPPLSIPLSDRRPISAFFVTKAFPVAIYKERYKLSSVGERHEVTRVL